MKNYTTTDVFTSALKRLNYIFDEFENVSVSFSGGKDSTVLMHLAMQVAKERNRRLRVLFLDLEGQYKATIDHIEEMIKNPMLDVDWVCLPINLRNAVSVFQPHWCAWEQEAKDLWVRDLPTHPCVISDPKHFPFFKHRMEFEEFVPAYGKWLAEKQGKTAVLVGIRADESLNRFRTIFKVRASRYKNVAYSKVFTDKLCNFYPIYDFRTEDIWTAIGKNGWEYNKLYDMMYLAGKGIHEMRICQPYGDDQRKGLDLFHTIEPETWSRVVNRVSGANFGNIYCGGKILGNYSVDLPKGHTWETFTRLLLNTLPEASQKHYDKKFKVFLDWWKENEEAYKDGIPDFADEELEAAKKAPSWRRLAKCIIKNDFWCKSLSFAQTKDIVKKHYDTLEKLETL